MIFYVILALVVFYFIVFVVSSIYGPKRSEKIIKNKVESIGGRLIKYEGRNFSKDTGPFKYAGRDTLIYYIEYEVNGQTKELWLRIFAIIFKKWIFSEDL